MAEIEHETTSDVAERVSEAMQDGGWWQPCTGCHETVDGHETGHYPYSKVFRCHVGAGCCECGGIGVVWQRFTAADAAGMEAATADDEEQTRELIRHVKSGGVYEVLFRGAQIQTDTPLTDYAKVDGYRHVETGAVWVRPGTEMSDGRFVPVEPAEMPAALAMREAARG